MGSVAVGWLLGQPIDPLVCLVGLFSTPERVTNLLGLALCRRLVEAMQGRIGAERRTSGGALFWVSLPLPHSGAAD